MCTRERVRAFVLVCVSERVRATVCLSSCLSVCMPACLLSVCLLLCERVSMHVCNMQGLALIQLALKGDHRTWLQSQVACSQMCGSRAGWVS